MTPEQEQAAAVEGFYSNGEWKPGHVMYQCAFCAFDSLSVPVIREHVITRHQLQVVAQQVPLTVTLYGPDGKQIESREVTDGEISNQPSAARR